MNELKKRILYGFAFYRIVCLNIYICMKIAAKEERKKELELYHQLCVRSEYLDFL